MQFCLSTYDFFLPPDIKVLDEIFQEHGFDLIKNSNVKVSPIA